MEERTPQTLAVSLCGFCLPVPPRQTPHPDSSRLDPEDGARACAYTCVCTRVCERGRPGREVGGHNRKASGRAGPSFVDLASLAAKRRSLEGRASLLLAVSTELVPGRSSILQVFMDKRTVRFGSRAPRFAEGHEGLYLTVPVEQT